MEQPVHAWATTSAPPPPGRTKQQMGIGHELHGGKTENERRGTIESTSVGGAAGAVHEQVRLKGVGIGMNSTGRCQAGGGGPFPSGMPRGSAAGQPSRVARWARGAVQTQACGPPADTLSEQAHGPARFPRPFPPPPTQRFCSHPVHGDALAIPDLDNLVRVQQRIQRRDVPLHFVSSHIQIVVLAKGIPKAGGRQDHLGEKEDGGQGRVPG